MRLNFSILMDAFFIALLLWCTNTDLKERIILNLQIVLLICLGFAHTGLVIMNGNTWWIYPAGLLFAIPFFTAWLKNSMGAGDVKLVMAIALYLGLWGTLVAFALMIPVLIVMIICAKRKHNTLKRIPFAPVIGTGAISVVVFGYLYGMMKF